MTTIKSRIFYTRKYVENKVIIIFIIVLLVLGTLIYRNYFQTASKSEIARWIADVKEHPKSTSLEVSKLQSGAIIKQLSQHEFIGLKPILIQNEKEIKNKVIVKLDVDYKQLDELYYTDYDKYLTTQQYLLSQGFLKPEDFNEDNYPIKAIGQFPPRHNRKTD